MKKNHDLQERLDSALAEIERLRNENRALCKALSLSNKLSSKSDAAAKKNSGTDMTGTQKVKLYRSLFRGREDVYAVRWQSSKGIVGYSPVHCHKKDRTQCRRPREECEKLGERLYFPQTDQVIHGHLTGKFEVGIYPLLEDDKCCFLAIDFDKKTWKEDVEAFTQTCIEAGITAYPERFRSGSGVHVCMSRCSRFALPQAVLGMIGSQHDGIRFIEFHLFPPSRAHQFPPGRPKSSMALTISGKLVRHLPGGTFSDI